MRILLITLCLSVWLCAGGTPSYAELKAHTYYRVIKVIDGDTIKLSTGESVRLLGIDAPELKNGEKFRKDLKRYHLTKAEQIAMGKRSKQFVKGLVEGKKVHLKFDKDKYDKYHRTLAYVFLPSGTFVNAEIVKDGYAYPYSAKPELEYGPLFRRLYAQAKTRKAGLWKEERPAAKHPQWFKKTSRS